MEWWQSIILGLVQGLTEFLPVSSSGHLMMFKELLGVDGENFLDYTVTVHCATVLSTIVVFWPMIWSLLKGLFAFRYNDATDYVCKLIISMIPIFIIGIFFKDAVESLFGDSLTTVAICLLVTAALLWLSDHFSFFSANAEVSSRVLAQAGAISANAETASPRNGISFWQAFVVGLGQSFAVAPGLSRSGTTIATGLICGVRREAMAQFSFLMVLAPIIGEQLLDVLKGFSADSAASSGLGALPLALGFIAAFLSGLFACKAMVAIVRSSRLSWFALYCLVAAGVCLIFG